MGAGSRCRSGNRGGPRDCRQHAAGRRPLPQMLHHAYNGGMSQCFQDDGGPNALTLAYALALYPPSFIDRRLRRDLSERGLPCPHRFHVSLKYSFVPAHEMTDEWEQLQALVASLPPLRLRSSGMLASAATYCHLLLIEQDPALMRLHECAMSILGTGGALISPETAAFEGKGFNPHITLGYGSSSDDFEQHHVLLADYEPVVEFSVEVVERVDSLVTTSGRSTMRRTGRAFPFSRGVARG
jgi:2'-5' RNA ligase